MSAAPILCFINFKNTNHRSVYILFVLIMDWEKHAISCQAPQSVHVNISPDLVYDERSQSMQMLSVTN